MVHLPKLPRPEAGASRLFGKAGMTIALSLHVIASLARTLHTLIYFIWFYNSLYVYRRQVTIELLAFPALSIAFPFNQMKVLHTEYKLQLDLAMSFSVRWHPNRRSCLMLHASRRHITFWMSGTYWSNRTVLFRQRRYWICYIVYIHDYIMY